MSDHRPGFARRLPIDDVEEPRETRDHFVQSNGQMYAGTHLLLDLWGASRLDDVDYIEQTLRQAVQAAGAELLHIHLHRFTQGGGISGVAVLAESHISVHTWPERDYAAFDIFMCGRARPALAARSIEQRLHPRSCTTHQHRRGLIEDV